MRSKVFCSPQRKRRSDNYLYFCVVIVVINIIVIIITATTYPYHYHSNNYLTNTELLLHSLFYSLSLSLFLSMI